MRPAKLLFVPVVLLLPWCAQKAGEPREDPAAGTGGTSGASDVLPCIAPIVSRSCATADCHDSITKEHGMDLSTGEGIYDAWLGPNGTGRNGLDHCRNDLRRRITPGVPSESYVFMKITGMLACQGEFSRPMPPPPAMPLSSEEITAIRVWIENGAARDCSASGGGTSSGGSGGSSAGGTAPTGGVAADSNGGTAGAGGFAGADGGEGTGGSGAMDGGPDDGGPDDAGDDGSIVDPWVCTDTQPCTGGLLCVGYECGIAWECQGHYIEPDGGTLEHPCPVETATYCGCDGTTFVSQNTCPVRPYRYPGECGSGYNCDPLDDRCGGLPTCPPGETAAIGFDNCSDGCVPSTTCRCEYNWECPQGYVCDTAARYCALMVPDGGT